MSRLSITRQAVGTSSPLVTAACLLCAVVQNPRAAPAPAGLLLR
ncbi:hypothetical protein OG576_27930 [Streptomyces sp. NBC_01500]|nr:hypothetical protein [Streptomyces sp. NBC_01500]